MQDCAAKGRNYVNRKISEEQVAEFLCSHKPGDIDLWAKKFGVSKFTLFHLLPVKHPRKKAAA